MNFCYVPQQLGDDSNPTVMTERFGFGASFIRTRGVDALCKEEHGDQTRGNEKPAGLRKVNGDKR